MESSVGTNSKTTFCLDEHADLCVARVKKLIIDMMVRSECDVLTWLYGQASLLYNIIEHET